MSIDLEKLQKTLKFLRKRIYFWDGLLFLLVLFNFIFYQITVSLDKYILGAFKYFNLQTSNELNSLLFLLGFILVTALILLAWLHVRRIRKFKRDEIGILFAPDYPESLEEDVEKIYDSLIKEIKFHEFGLKFSVIKLPPNKKINSPKEASKVLRDFKGITAVWGTVDKEGVGDRATGFSKIYFTHVYRPALIELKGLTDRVTQSLIGRKWKMNERNLLADRQVIARDIGLVVRNLIGISLYIDRRFDDAIKVFLPLSNQLRITVIRENKPHIVKFYHNVRIDCAMCLHLLTTEEYERYLFYDTIFNIPRQKCSNWIKQIDTAIKLDTQNSIHYLVKAIYLFLMGNISEAIRFCNKAIELAPKADAAPSLSLAFLYAFDGDFEKSRRLYRRSLAMKTSYDEVLINQLLLFMEQTIVKYPDKIQLCLVLGLLELYRGDGQKGLVQVITFIKLAKGRTEMLSFLNEAQRLLKQFEK